MRRRRPIRAHATCNFWGPVMGRARVHRKAQRISPLRVLTAAALLAVALPFAVVVAHATVQTSAQQPAAHSAVQRPRPTPRPTATPTPSPTPTLTSQPSPSPTSCGCGAAPISYAGASYCPGYIFGIRRTLYGVGTRIVLRGVVVGSVAGTRVQVSGGPSCLPDEWCGQSIPSLTVVFPTAAAVPRYGDVISLHGTTTAGGLMPAGFEATGYCDPFWGDC